MNARAPGDDGGGHGYDASGSTGAAMIGPEEIPRIDGDMGALMAHADSLAVNGTAFADTGARIHGTWQGLAPVYRAPESDLLLIATGPVMSVSASVGEDFGSAATALRTYATDTAQIQARLDVLRAQAVDLGAAASAAQDESTTATLDERGGELSAQVAAEIAAWEAAQRRCADALRALTSTGPATTLVEPLPGSAPYPIAPGGTLQEIYPVDPLPPATGTGYPPVVAGPGILVNVPAPPGPTVVDGPGSYVPPFGPGGLLLDAATADADPAGEGVVPDLPVREPVGNAALFPPDDFEETEYSADELAAMAFRHTGSGDMHIGGNDDRPTEEQALETLEKGTPTPLDGQNAVRYDLGDVRVIINRDTPWKSTSYYPER